MNMKKWFALVPALALTLSACSGGGTSSTPAPAATDPSESTAPSGEKTEVVVFAAA